MKITILLVLLLLNSRSFADVPTFPEAGTYECPISYEEYVNISIAPGELFPEFGGNLETPRKREEVLKLKFENEDLTVLNPETLPNWLLITAPFYKEQESYNQENEDGTRSFYVDWYGTWYFGSTIRVTPESYEAYGFMMELYFDDNDGWRQSLNGISCKKL